VLRGSALDRRWRQLAQRACLLRGHQSALDAPFIVFDLLYLDGETL
jgi:ATP-dependent DNA ligase